MNKLALFIIVIMIISCQNEGTDPNNSSLCSNCIYGSWELINSYELIGNYEQNTIDTIYLFKNGVETTFWYNQRLNNIPDQYFRIDFQNDMIVYNYNIYPISEEFTGEWRWLNSNFSKTHIQYSDSTGNYFPERFFRVVKITEDRLILERRNGITGWYKYYEFRKLDDSQTNVEKRLLQMPNEIIGRWILEEYLDKKNDSVFYKIKEDTLTIQFYAIGGRPPIYIKQVNKSYYKLELNIEGFGVFNGLENSGRGFNYSFQGFWYWYDTINPHEGLYINPFVGFGGQTEYKVDVSKKDILLLKNSENTYYIFKRMHN